MLNELAQRIVAIVADPNATRDDLGRALNEMLSRAGPANSAQRAEAMATLAAAMPQADALKGPLLAIGCGALVEGGVDPSPLVAPMLARLGELAPLARRLHEACAAAIPPDQEPQGDEDPFGQAFARLAPTMPDEAAACRLLDDYFPAAIAMFSVSPDARARGAFLRPDLDVIARQPAKAGWIASILKVLHEEPYVAIEPATKLGIAGKMSGISENFQLNVLLMDIFPQKGFFARRRISTQAAQIARGLGPQTSEEIVTGAWNLYTWQALRPDKTLPSATELHADGNWIWNEGTPADIPVFDGRRVVLLGEPSYQRTWRSQRSFAELPGELTVEQKLGAKEVDAWLDRMAVGK